MSALINLTGEYTSKQLRLIAEARAADGVHVVFQNGYKAIDKNEDNALIFPTGLMPGLKFVHVFHFQSFNGTHIFRFQTQGRVAYVEYALVSQKSEFTGWKTLSSKTIVAESFGTTYSPMSPGFHVIQAEIDSSAKMMIQDDGTNIWSAYEDVPGFTLDIFKKLVLHEFTTRLTDVPTFYILMEMHVIKTAQSSPSTFNNGQEFLMPTVKLSPGAYITWTGSVDTDTAVVIKDDTTELFSHTGKTTNLSVMMKVMRDSIVIGEDGKAALTVAVDKYKATRGDMRRSKISVSKEFSLTNCFVQSGVLSNEWV
ncbi:uncharacterized protein LOC135378829 [Ornithodoros turicata]|uniref:uncharacterized protein LOC135378829 n=1 Tax=Ornithodoros turicata TaxID=34597 RepID=UPI00313A390B